MTCHGSGRFFHRMNTVSLNLSIRMAVVIGKEGEKMERPKNAEHPADMPPDRLMNNREGTSP